VNTSEDDRKPAVIEYIGSATARFTDPAGVLRGVGAARFFEDGSSEITLLVDSIEGYTIPEPRGWALMAFFKGKGSWIGNACEEFVLQTKNGRLSAVGRIYYTYDINGGIVKVIILGTTTRFVVTEQSRSTYWVLPLTNCQTSLFYSYPDLDSHPLRRSWKPGAENVTPGKAADDEFAESNRLIAYERNGKLEFLEGLRPRHLASSTGSSALSAILVGNVNGESIHFDQLGSWLPFDLLLLLSMATGNKVDYPWVEFWSADGSLLERLHPGRKVSRYPTGHRAIEEQLHRGIGYLLTRALASPVWGTPTLRICLGNYIRGSATWEMDDKIGHFSRALDALASYYRVTTQSLLNDLDSYVADQVQVVCKTAASAVRALATGSSSDANLDRIAQRITNAIGTERHFGLAVVELIRHFGFSDAQILDSHFALQPRIDKRAWPGLLSTCRGTALHGGSFMQLGPDYMDDLFVVGRHLQDLLLRMMFVSLGYDHEYAPPVLPGLASMPVGWVDQTRTAQDLGYSDTQNYY
jgi:hypothetical protein